MRYVEDLQGGEEGEGGEGAGEAVPSQVNLRQSGAAIEEVARKGTSEGVGVQGEVGEVGEPMDGRHRAGEVVGVQPNDGDVGQAEEADGQRARKAVDRHVNERDGGGGGAERGEEHPQRA